MKITPDKTNFKSGLTSKLLRDFHRINIPNSEAHFAKMGINARFLDNKFVCGGSMLTANILQEISAKYKLPFNYLPHAIRVYKDQNLSNIDYQNSDAFCTCDTEIVLKDEPQFLSSSLFFNDSKNKSAIKTNIQASFAGFFKGQSSTHFLHTILHEWFHCIHNNLIFKKFGYEGDSPEMLEKYGKEGACGLKKLVKEDFKFDILLIHNDIIAKTISEYAAETCSCSEIFAELMSMITAKSLNRKLQPTTNPLDYIPKNLPKSVHELIEETLEI